LEFVMAEKAAYNAGKAYVPTRTDEVGEVPRTLLPGEIATSEASGVAHVMRADGRVSTLPTAKGFSSIEVLSQDAYDALVSATATISTTLYVVTADAES
jgi:hypothetical protein